MVNVDSTTTTGSKNLSAGDQNDVDEDCCTCYLILGDGDFTFSLDMANYFVVSQQQQQEQKQQRPIKIVATGIDSAAELSEKYRDISFTLQQLHKINNTTTKDVAVTVQHQVNALYIQQQPSKGAAASSAKTDSSSSQSGAMTIQIRDDHIEQPENNQNNRNPQPPIMNTLSPTEELEEKVAGSDNDIIMNTADQVIFNFPHVGREDAVTHQQFLCHLFYAVRHTWFKKQQQQQQQLPNDNETPGCRATTTTATPPPPPPVFHLTLAQHQYERWHCAAAAAKHNMLLLHRSTFCPPLAAVRSVGKESGNNSSIIRSHDDRTGATPQLQRTTTAYYQSRRHQSGKSFATRVSLTNETFTYCRQEDFQRLQQQCRPGDDDDDDDAAMMPLNTRLPWCQDTHSTTTTATTTTSSASLEPSHVSESTTISTCEKDVDLISLLPFACPHCEKRFKEERSVKNHIRIKHDDLVSQHQLHNQNDATKHCTKRNHATINDTIHVATVSSWSCHYCSRNFAKESALQDHVRAKHVALHTDLRPDWLLSSDTKRTNALPSATVPTRSWHCKICDATGGSAHDESLDDGILMRQHIQSFCPSSKTHNLFPCTFCNKTFHQDRARRQHENTCTETSKRQRESRTIDRFE